jgi:hypothetical protein
MNEKVEELLKDPWVIRAAIGAVAFGGGLGLGWFLGKRKYEITVAEGTLDFHEVPEQLGLDFEAAREDIYPEPEVEEIVQQTRPPKVVIDEHVAREKEILKVDDLSQLRPSMIEVDEDAPDVIVVDVEEGIPEEVVTAALVEVENWDWEEEVRNRTETAPYILHKDEFYADEKNYSQVSLTFYAVDEILADEDDKPIYNHSNTTGPLRFGHGSGQADVVYIRNDMNRAEYEVTRLDALYSMEVLGLEIENNERVADIRHSKHTRFRMD